MLRIYYVIAAVPSFQSVSSLMINEEHEDAQKTKRRRLERPTCFLEGNDGIQDRLDLQHLGDYILTGGSKTTVSHASFEVREKEARDVLIAFLHKNFDEDAAEKIMEKVQEYIVTTENISLTVGMKIGATLALKLTNNFEADV